MHPDYVPSSESERRRVKALLAALRSDIEVRLNPGSWLIDDAFAEEFRSRILCQHLFMSTILSQSGFDAAFLGAARAKGCVAAAAPEGQRFWDEEIDGKRISLKSSQAKGLRLQTLHISKLTEAAWIQDCRSARARMNRVKELFDDYVSSVQSIIQLRYFSASQTYELVEVPVVLLRQTLDLEVASFQADGPSINIPVGQSPPDFTLKLDRSDAKITLAR